MQRTIRGVVFSLIVLSIIICKPVFGAKYTPSVTYKPGPSIVEIENEQDVTIYDEKGNQVSNIPSGEIIVTPISEVDSAPYDDIKENLTTANDKLNNKGLYEICPDIQSVVDSTAPGVKEKQLVVKEVFNLSVYGQWQTYLEKPGNYIFLTFKVDISKNQPMFVMIHAPNGEWKVIPAEYVVRNSDGTITIRFDYVGTIAFIVPQGTMDTIDKDNPEYTSPQTGYETVNLIPLCFISFVTLCIVIFIRLISKRKNR